MAAACATRANRIVAHARLAKSVRQKRDPTSLSFLGVKSKYDKPRPVPLLDPKGPNQRHGAKVPFVFRTRKRLRAWHPARRDGRRRSPSSEADKASSWFQRLPVAASSEP